MVGWVKSDVDKDRYPGAVVLVVRDGKVLLHEAVGWADKERGVPMARDSIHPIASSTKLSPRWPRCGCSSRTGCASWRR